uniref:AlNc14C4G633 protein n=1 Tax=Albugo laibachii Nc14 TaxID=890382 RepID=F0W0J1_9STRA|nr:AlNc14C4G633 [Albugo laibachii Nc14]|eukprot:CCA14563.1 AlNc14C4G633 [Albugo laibachii Nc14]
MRTVLIKTFGLVTVGVFQAHHQFARAQYVKLIPAASTQSSELCKRGLEVVIKPPLIFTKTGRLIKPEKSKQLYQVTLVIQDQHSSKNGGIWESGDLSMGKPRKSFLSRTRYFFIDQERTSERILTRTNEYVKVRRRSRQTFGSGTYYTGWEFDWKSLNKLIEWKQLDVSSKSTTVTVESYLSNNKGRYAFTWNNDISYVLRFGTKESSEGNHPHTSFLPENKLPTAKMTLDNELYTLKFNFASEIIEVPVWTHRLLEPIIFRSKQAGEFHQAKCKSPDYDIISLISMEEFVTKLILNHKTVLTFTPSLYIKQNGDHCTLLLKKSSANVWVLGLPFLREYFVNVDTTGTTILYQIF